MDPVMNGSHDRASESRAAASGIDVLSDVLHSVRLTGSMLFLVDATTPWATWAPPADAFRPVVLPATQHLISYHVVTQGHCWAGLLSSPLERFETGDVLVIPHGAAYILANAPDCQATYGPEEGLTFFRQMAAGELPSVVQEGGGGKERTQFICGFLGCDVRPFNPVLATLPAMIHVRAASRASDRTRHLIEFALGELREPRPGSQGVLLRLAELLFIEVVRLHLESLSGPETGWLAGLRDPIVARALTLLHGSAGHRWTLEALAARVGSSRSVLAERFTQVVGQPPMQDLTQWRMQMAARLLSEPDAKIVAVADAVGYESEAAFSRAFKRSVGLAPAEWRRNSAACSPVDAGVR